MLTTGLILSGLTVGGFYLIFSKCPKRLQKFLIDRPLFTDCVAAIFTYILFGTSTVIGLLAAGWSAVIVSLMFAARKNPGIMYWFGRIKEIWKKTLNWIANSGKEVVVADYTPELEQQAEKVMVN